VEQEARDATANFRNLQLFYKVANTEASLVDEAYMLITTDTYVVTL
jgi:hypothetical protein